MQKRKSRATRTFGQKRVGKRRKNDSSGPGPAVVSFRGRIRTPSELQQRHTIVQNLTLNFQITSSGAGLIANVFASDPAVSGPTGWTALKGLYDEFRVLGLEVDFCPSNADYAPATFPSPVPVIATVIDHDSVAALTAYSGLTTGADAYESNALHILTKRFKVVAKMCDFQEASFGSTSAAPAKTYYIKFFCSPASVSTSYGYAAVTWKIQFRGKGF